MCLWYATKKLWGNVRLIYIIMHGIAFPLLNYILTIKCKLYLGIIRMISINIYDIIIHGTYLSVVNNTTFDIRSHVSKFLYSNQVNNLRFISNGVEY